MARIADGPGYGFANVTKTSENKFRKLLKVYLSESSRLCRIFWCLNPEHGFSENDRIVFNFIKHLNLSIQIVFTKADKIPPLVFFEKAKAMSHPLKPYADIVCPLVHFTSAETDFGIQELRNSIKQAIIESPTRTIFKKAGKIAYLPEDHYTEFERDKYRLLIENEKQIKSKLLENENKSLLRG